MYTDIGLILAEAIPIGLTYIFPSERVRCVHYLAVFMLVLILTNITKLSYHDPRPYWVDTPQGDTKIQAFSCSSQYGNPSGHSSTTMAMALAMALDFAHTGNKLVFKLLGFACAITFAVTIAYSRLFLGVHSLDQVLFGLLLGAWCALTMQYCARPNLEKEV